ncbi:MAG: cation diffusion facilitator family transporter [Pseudobdellovibrionaceae bacterium]
MHDHDHTHDHTHDHGHGNVHHHHIPKNFNQAFKVGIVLNLSFVLIEFCYGYFANSMALVADAGHNLSDVLALALAWAAAVAGTKKPTHSLTYGLKGGTILASLMNSLLLYAVLGIILWESVERLYSPQEVASLTMMIVAACGVFINGVTAAMFHSGKDSDLNIKGAYLHMMGDMLISVAVVISGAVIYFTELNETPWLWIDPLVGIAVCFLIGRSTWGLLKESIYYTLNGVPRNIDFRSVKQFLLSRPGVVAIHDLHIWGMSTSENALTAHLIMPDGVPQDQFYIDLANELKSIHNIHHVTVQVERRAQQGCVLEPDEVV